MAELRIVCCKKQTLMICRFVMRIGRAELGCNNWRTVSHVFSCSDINYCSNGSYRKWSRWSYNLFGSFSLYRRNNMFIINCPGDLWCLIDSGNNFELKIRLWGHIAKRIGHEPYFEVFVLSYGLQHVAMASVATLLPWEQQFILNMGHTNLIIT